MATPSIEQPVDALDVIFTQDQALADLFAMWRRTSEQLNQGDDIDLRWRRGSAVKLLLQHLAVREAAKEALVRRVTEAGQEGLATKLNGDAISRREGLAALDELGRGQQAISLNFPEIDAVVAEWPTFLTANAKRMRARTWQRRQHCWGHQGSGGRPAPAASRCKA